MVLYKEVLYLGTHDCLQGSNEVNKVKVEQEEAAGPQSPTSVKLLN